MKSHKTHAKQILTGLRSPLSLLEGLSPSLIGWMTIVGAWSAAVGTDGFVPYYELRNFEHAGEPLTEETIEALVVAGRWEREKRGIAIVDWHVTQASDEVEEQYHEDLDEPDFKKVDAEAVYADLRAANELEVPEDDNEVESAPEGLSATPVDDSEEADDDDFEEVVDEPSAWSEEDSEDFAYEDNDYDDDDVVDDEEPESDDDDEEVHSTAELMELVAPKRPERRSLNHDAVADLAVAIKEADTEYPQEFVNFDDEEEVLIDVTVKSDPNRGGFEYSDKEIKNAYDDFLDILWLQPERKMDCWKLFQEEVEAFGIDTVLDAADDYAFSTGGTRTKSPRFKLRKLPEAWMEDDGVGRYVKKQKEFGHRK